MENESQLESLARVHLGALNSTPSCKAVQVRIGEKDYLFVGPSDRFHRDYLRFVLEKFRLDIPCVNIGGIMCPDRESPNYKLTGAGYAKSTSEEIIFYGKSADYDLGIDKESLINLKGFFQKGIKIMYQNPGTYELEQLCIGEGRQ